MKTASLEISAVGPTGVIGFRRILPTGPGGDRFGLYLPSAGHRSVTFADLSDIFEREIGFASRFEYKFSSIFISGDDFSQDSRNLIIHWLQDIPMEEDCRISLPCSMLLGGPL